MPAVTVNNTGSIFTGGNNSSAIEAQSIGGGGGDGGFSIGLSGTFNNDSTSKLQTVGGNGGAAGNAGDVVVNANATANSTPSIITVGDLSYGILAQSVGGGGGNGGFSIAGSLSTGGGAAANATGGNGAGGGNAGLVTVTAGGSITTGTATFVSGIFQKSTSGEGSVGILAQSIGGGGGSGGFSGGLSLGLSGDASTNTTGGTGGAGGTAGAVSVTTLAGASITTFGDNASGILAQSVGGGGGNGGFSIGASFNNSSGKSATNTVGGNAGAGSTGGNVTVMNAATITTFGILSNGILAQSIGGGGGNGGFAVAGTLSLGGDATGNTTGGTGGTGENAGTVTVNNTAMIQVNGTGAIGILAQSLGGGGGNGGFAGGVSFSTAGTSTSDNTGGNGVLAGDGNTVSVTNSANISTFGTQGIGIFAQSVGGGGGNGGFSISASGSTQDTANSQSVGGKGGAAGAGGNVTVQSTGAAITTVGDLAYGILAQSVGGGGGNGGFAVAGSLSTNAGAEANATGGDGAGGGSAGTVSVTMGGSITTGRAIFINGVFQNATSGEGSVGILAQSIGGGGGNGGFSGGLALGLSGNSTTNTTGGNGGVAGNANTVTVTTLAGSTITTFGDNAAGILAQSVGGGGGNGGFSVSAAFSNSSGKSATTTTGGQGAAGGTGSGVTVTNAANITTYGYLSDGIFAQSVGGGGGNGGFAVSGSLSLGDSAASNTTGGQGGAGGNGYTILTGFGACGVTATCTMVQVTNTGTIQVFQMGNVGILAQSVGGGGGNGGFAGGISFSNSSSATTNTVGGQGGGAGNGGEVDVFNYGTVAMLGAHSIGILAQSVGGGGGNGGFSISAGGSTSASAGATDSVGGAGGLGGTGGVVNVTNELGSEIVTNGIMSYGILAQSVGGGGGNGGFALSGSFSSGGDDASSNVGGGMGGVAGGGGASNTVTVTNYGMIITEAANSMGIVAQSIGGGGGTGGFAGQLSVNSSSGGAMSNTVGGQGGGGGAGGEVDVTNKTAGVIQTLGANSIGILAQSVGGGGGAGGFTITGSGSAGGNTAATTVGGGGGSGGNGGVVNVTNNGQIITSGLMSAGIFAQSVGGGGGAGGFAITGSLNVGSGGSSNSVGGSCNATCGGGGGGGGGNGGNVTVNNTGTIMVTQAGSIGIVAQSVGGGGGSAGFTGQMSFGGGALNNQVGGMGGNGGNGGNVVVTSTGNIITTGDNSIAVLAQSIGGGGGNGAITLTGSTDGSVSGTDLNVGGQNTGGSQGSKGTVTVNIGGGTTTTDGALAYGLLAQAIGAGGGNGSLVVPDPLTIIGDPTIQVGANGSIGGDGSAMNTANSNNVTTTNVGAVAQVVQSIGGGGGTNGMAGDVVASGVPFNLFIGGNNTSAGNLGGNGGTLQYTNTGQVTTTGNNSIGFLLQSIGGGGGLGTYSYGSVTGTGNTVTEIVGGSQAVAGNGSTVTIPTFSGNVLTQGLLSEGVVAQSIGGGGGVASLVVSSGGINLAAGGLQLSAGGAGGPGGNGEAVTLASTARYIETTNIGALGIIAQSIGGGGGVAQVYGPAVSGSNTITLGAANGAAGNGGSVTLSNSGEVLTTGLNAHAILAQSIGGGGGFVQAFGANGAPLNLAVAAGAGGGGGNGGAVSVTSTGAIMTTGVGADGVIAQSIGGGGGLVGGGAFALSLPTTGSFAGTAGGSGSGGTVGITASANISATGLNSTAIFAESLGASGGNTITVNVNSGTLITGGYLSGSAIPVAGNAIALVGGLNNTIANAGMLTTVSNINGMTITGGIGSNAVSNTGYVIGSLNLCLNGGCGPVNSFDNKSSGGLVYDTVCVANGGTNCIFSGAIFDSGSTVYLGSASVAGNVLSNEGLMSPGGYLNVATTNVTGNFTQSTTGIYGLDLNFLNQTSDLINITGTASVSGTVSVNINNPSLALPGTYQTTIVAAAGEVTSHAGLTLDALATAVAQYSLVYPNPNDIDLQYSINFSPSGLTTNEHSVGNAVNAIQTARSSPNFAPIAAALFYQPTVAALGQVYDSLSGEGVSGAEQTAFAANQLFMNSISQQTQIWLGNAPSNPNSIVMYADDALGYAGVDPQNPISKALAARAVHVWRFWSEPYGGGGSISGELPLGTAQLGYSGGGLAVGTDYQVDPDTIIGLAVGGNLSSFDVSGRATTGTVQGGQLSAYAAKRWGPLYATGIAGFGVFSNTEQRFAVLPGTTAPIIPVPGFAEQLNGSFASQSFNARFEAGWRVTYDDFNVTPFGAVEYGLLHSDQFAEAQANGPDLLGLAYASHFVDSVPTFLGVQFNSMKSNSPDRLTYWTRLSWMHEFEPYRTIDPSFLAAPGFDFTVNGALAPRNAAALDLGLKYALTPHLNALASFNGLFAPEGISYAGTAGLQSQW